MKVQIENTSPVERKILFEIPGEVVSQEMESSYRSLNRRVKFKGFRPGKVPRSILERHYKNQVEEEVLSKLMMESFERAVEENHLTPVAAPTITERFFESGKEFKYTMTVEIKPEVLMDGYLGIEVEREAVSVSEEEVEAQLKILQETHAQLKSLEVKRPVQEKDLVIFDFEGSLSGKPLEGWKANDHLVEVGSKTLVGDLDLQLIGLSAGEEKVTSITLPETYVKKELAGQEIKVRLQVKEIKEKILPSLDDEFAKDVGEYSTLEELKTHLRKRVKEQKQTRADQAAKEKLLTALVEKGGFPVPQSLIQQRVQTLMARTEQRLAQQGMKLVDANQDQEKLRQSFMITAEKEVRGSLILEKIAEVEKLSVSQEELDAKISQIAVQLNQRPEAVKNHYSQKGLLEDLRAQMREEKTLDFLLGKAAIKGEASPSTEPTQGTGLEESR